MPWASMGLGHRAQVRNNLSTTYLGNTTALYYLTTNSGIATFSGAYSPQLCWAQLQNYDQDLMTGSIQCYGD